MMKNSFITGIVVGAVWPIVIYGLLLFLFDTLIKMGLLDPMRISTDLKQRTLPLVALCSNALVMQYLHKKNWTETMRGLVFPTLLFAGIWFWKYAYLFI